MNTQQLRYDYAHYVNISEEEYNYIMQDLKRKMAVRVFEELSNSPTPVVVEIKYSTIDRTTDFDWPEVVERIDTFLTPVQYRDVTIATAPQSWADIRVSALDEIKYQIKRFLTNLWKRV